MIKSERLVKQLSTYLFYEQLQHSHSIVLQGPKVETRKVLVAKEQIQRFPPLQLIELYLINKYNFACKP